MPHENYLARAHVFSYGIPAVIVAVNTAITLSLSFNEKTPSPIFEEGKTILIIFVLRLCSNGLRIKS